jgi:rod shape determining protein RodA
MNFTVKKESPSKVYWPLLLAVVGLIIVGVCFIYSATIANESANSVRWYNQYYFRQIVWCLFGLSLAVGTCLIDYQRMSRWSYVVYWLAILFLVLVFIIGSQIYGARRWIDMGPFKLQPSEFAKLAFILAMANFLSRPASELREPVIVAKGLGLMILPFLLILKEPDLGSALIFLPVGLAMLFTAEVPTRYLAKLVGAGAFCIVLLVVDVLYAPPKWQINLADYQKRRLLVYFGRDSAVKSSTAAERAEAKRQLRMHSYNVDQALISVGSGGLLGKGWCKGTQNALGYLPRAVAHNDFIFSVLAEEKGFMGSVIVLTLYSVVLFTGLSIAGQARDRLGKLLAVGVVALWFSHVFINIGMNIRLMPVTGVPLPLLSYGGSSVFCSLIAAGILHNVYIHRRSY